MPNIATGAKSALAYKEEITFNTAPSGNWTGMTFENETLGATIPRVMSNEIRPTRTVPSIRGGNTGAGGNVTADLSVDRYGLFLKHLLAATVVTTSTGLYATGSLTSDNTNVSDADTVTIGSKTYTFKTALTPTEGEVLIGADADASLANLILAINHTGTPDTDYKCATAHPTVTAETTITAHVVVVNAIAAGTAGDSIATTEAATTLSWGAATLASGANTGGAYTVSALTTATYQRGTVVSSNSRYYLVTDTGVVSSVGGGLTVTSGTQTLGTATFEYLSTTGVAIYEHVLPGGVDFPTGGISLEKKLAGISSSTYAVFTGGRINSLDITVRQEAIVQAAWAFLFVQPVDPISSTVAGTPTYAVEDPSMSYEAWITLGTDGTCRPATDITLKIMNNLDDKVYTVNSRIRREIPAGRRECSGNFTVFFEDETELDAFTAETENEMTISFNRNGEYLAFVMGETKLNGDGTPKISGPGVIKASFDYMAFQQDGTTDITATMISLEPTLR